MVFEPVQKTLLDMAVAEVPKPSAILDVGCGTGRLLRAAELRFTNARLEGVDAAEEMIGQAEAALARGSRIRFALAAAEKLPFPEASFDLIFSTMTFHHWADQAKAIGEVGRVLAPGGRWLLADFIATGPMRWVFRLIRPRRFHEIGTVRAMLAPVGLTVVRHQSVPGLWGQVSVLAIGR